MKIALLHYHLKPGGVTTVVRQQAKAVENDCRVCILAGETEGEPAPPGSLVLPQLAYTTTACNPETVAEEILSAMNKALGGPCDVLHVHNPTLNKNVNLLKILRVLQHRGIRLLVQIHDFAEDGRPDACSRDPYPDNCHYAAINSRDHRILQLAGLGSQGLHLLPNMIDAPCTPPAGARTQPLVLYPVRAIRRKNIGEALLISLFLQPPVKLGITLPPNSPGDWASYLTWQKFAERHRLNVQFEMGQRRSFSSLMQSARYIITTSIAEGFGFSFLEPWIHGKALLGRKLPRICHDFERAGVSLQHLYTRLRIPLTWIDQKRFQQAWSHRLHKAARQFDYRIPAQMTERTFATLTAAGDIDFGLLDESTQQGVVGRLIKHASLKKRLQAYNPFLNAFSKSMVPENLIAANRRTIQLRFSADHYRRQLLKMYRVVIRREVSHSIDKRRLVEAFLHPPDFSLLRWDAKIE